MQWLRFLHDGRETLGALEGDGVRVYSGELFGPHEPAD